MMKLLLPTLNTLSLMMVALSTVSYTVNAFAVEPLPYKKTITTYSVPDSYGRVATTTTTTDLFPTDTANITRQEQLKTITTNTFVTPDLVNKWSQQDLVLCQNQAISQKTNGIEDNAINQRNAWRYDAKGRVWKEIIEPSAADCIQESNTTLTGRLVNETTYKPLGGIDTQKILSGLNLVPRTTASYSYDATGTYANITTNALSQSTSQIMDLGSNTLRSQTDINGLQSTWQYDSFGRETIELSPEGIQTKTTYSWCDGDNSCPTLAKYQIKVETTNGSQTVSPTTISYYDTLERQIKEKVQWDTSTWIVTSHKVYNALGQVDKEANPYFEGDATIYWTTYSYDVLGRVQVVKTSSGSSTVAYDALKTVVKNEKNQTKTTLIGIHGQPRKIIDTQGNILSINYSPLGLTATTTDPKGNTRNYVYDNLGNKLKDKDPDLGEWTYTYDGLNQVKTQVDTKNQTTSYEYDKLGRLTRRVEADLDSSWVYDTAPNGKGKIAHQGSKNGHEKAYYYDSLGRIEKINTYMDGTWYTTTNTYDSAGRAEGFSYPTGIGYKNVYDANGYLSEVRDINTQALYWKAIKRDADGHVTEEKLGNGLTTRRSYKADTGYIDTISTGFITNNVLSATVQNNSYSFDKLGNLNSRIEALNNVSETYGYDNLNRLTSATTGSVVKTAQYDVLGNITYRSDVGYYSYGPNVTIPNPAYTNWVPYSTWIPIGMGNGTPIFVWGAVSAPTPTLTVATGNNCGGAHRVCSIGGGSLNTQFAYDANGNMTSGNGRNYTWMSFNMPASITQGSNTESFVYDANHERVKRTSVENGQTTTTLYLNPRLDLGGTFEKNIKPDNSIEYVHHLYAGGQVLGSVVTTENYSAPTALWSTDLSTAPTTASPNSVGLTLPSGGFVTWETDGKLALRNKANPTTAYPGLYGQRTYSPDSNLLLRYEITPTSNNNQNMSIGLANNGAWGTDTYRRYVLLLANNTFAARYYDKNSSGQYTLLYSSLGAIQANTTYVVEIESTNDIQEMYVYPKGTNRASGYRHTVAMNWPAGYNKRLWSEIAVSSTTPDSVVYLDNISESRFMPTGTRYFHSDHLGSLNAITNNAGTVLERLSYDAWGKRRTMLGTDASGLKGTMSKHGFTGHETLDTVGLVHMNGRVYDPVVGRFVSADPHIDGVNDLQGYNTYSYVKNNPLSYTDLTGFYINIPTFTIPFNFNTFSFNTPTFNPTPRINIPNFTIPTSVNTRSSNFNFTFQAPSINLTPRPTTLSTSQVISNSNAYGRANGNSFMKTGYNATAEGGAGSAKNNYEFTIKAVAIGAVSVLADKVISNKIPVIGSKLTDSLEKALKGIGNPCSFSPDTMVLTPNGLIAIEQLNMGDLVLSRNDETGEVSAKKILHVFIEQHTNDIRVLTIKDETGHEEVVVTSDNHPFYMKGRGWVDAGALKVGDEIERLMGGAVRVVGVEQQSRPLMMYNFEIADFHTYAVGKYGTWVHNASPCLNNIKEITPSPALKGDPYHPDEVKVRQQDWHKLYGGFDPVSAAKDLGYNSRISPQKAPFHSHGQPVFSNGKGYISPDIDGHNVTNGWKMFDAKGRRTGTWDSNLSQRLKD